MTIVFESVGDRGRIADIGNEVNKWWRRTPQRVGPGCVEKHECPALPGIDWSLLREIRETYTPRHNVTTHVADRMYERDRDRLTHDKVASLLRQIYVDGRPLACEEKE